MLDLKPHPVDKFVWWYDAANCIEIVHEIRDKKGNYIRTDTFKISRTALKEYLKRAMRKQQKERLTP